MRLVHDNQIEVRGRVQPVAVAGLHAVDRVQYGGVRGEDDARVLVLLLVLRHAQVAKAHVGQVFLERVLGLIDQRHTVCQKKHVRGLVCAGQNIHQAGSGARLARAGRHNQQALAMALLEVGADSPDGLDLVVTARDIGIDAHGAGRQSDAAAVHQALQVGLGKHARAGPLGR